MKGKWIAVACLLASSAYSGGRWVLRTAHHLQPESIVAKVFRGSRHAPVDESLSKMKSVWSAAPKSRLARPVAQKIPQMLAASNSLGARLKAAQVRIPAHIFVRLWNQWQRNNWELNSVAFQLSMDDLTPERRQRLEAQALALEQKNAEIDRLVAQWG